MWILVTALLMKIFYRCILLIGYSVFNIIVSKAEPYIYKYVDRTLKGNSMSTMKILVLLHKLY